MASLPPLPAGVVFDCDGTLADSETLSARVWNEVLARHGVAVTQEDHAAIIGHVWPRGFDHFSARADLGDPDEFRAELRERAAGVFADELRLFPDAVETLRGLTDAGVPVAVASSSSHAHVLRCLERGDLVPLVSAVIGADDVRRHKPHPEPYLAAAAALGVDVTRCAAVEDTPTGLASARAAGTFTVAIERGAVDPAGLRGADRVVRELDLEAVIPPSGWVSPAA